MSRTDAATVIITMAGLGSRFRAAGYTVPKYKVDCHGRTLFAWSMESLRHFIDAGSPFIFVTLGADEAAPFIEEQCRALQIQQCGIVPLEHLTDGQATSALLASPALREPQQPVAIYNIDTYVEPQYLNPAEIRGAGWIPCFPGEGDKWSFAVGDSTGRVTEVREKQRISPHATVGLYWFQSFSLYEETYRQYYAAPENVERGERYIAPLYNHLVRQSWPVYLSEIPVGAVHPLGTPADVEHFREHYRAAGHTHA